jgi:amidase
VVNGDQYSGGGASTLPAVAGYPHLTVPMGYVKGLPVGLSFIGAAWQDAEILSLGYAYEQRTQARKAPAYLRSIEEKPGHRARPDAADTGPQADRADAVASTPLPVGEGGARGCAADVGG